MALARILAWAVAVAMIGLAGNIIVNSSLDQGLGMDRFLAGLADPWQTFIGFDLMAGLLLVAGWIAWRQKGARTAETVAWILCLTWWGNIVTAAYILVALRQSEADAARFFMGARAGTLRLICAELPLIVRMSALAGAIMVAGFTSAKIARLGLTDLPGQAYLAGCLPIVLALVLIAFPARSATSQ